MYMYEYMYIIINFMVVFSNANSTPPALRELFKFAYLHILYTITSHKGIGFAINYTSMYKRLSSSKSIKNYLHCLPKERGLE